ncbi:MAG: tRNA threonylcarbamoyladenosine dehydratase [Clostridiales bacterium]|nr:tRNA threonylcarbamoyladenosine dehydratase [Clostridiales bacterium]
MEERFIRTAYIVGDGNINAIRRSSVIVFGCGGVGSYVCEALARLGIGKITVVDGDKVSESNINRQLVALHSTVGIFKADVMAERIKDINPECEVRAINAFYNAENADLFSLGDYDFIVDAIDDVPAKLDIAQRAENLGVREISSMGTGNKLCSNKFEICDIYKTSVCPLARAMRRELKSRGVKKLTVVYSKEEPLEINEEYNAQNSGRRSPGSMPFVPGAAGLLIAEYVYKILTREGEDQ